MHNQGKIIAYNTMKKGEQENFITTLASKEIMASSHL